jgi:hypothetical protein
MAKGFAEASISQKKSSKSSSLKAAVNCEQIQKQWAEHFEELNRPLRFSRCSSSVYEHCNDCPISYYWWSQRREDIETYGVSHEAWLSGFLALPFKIPPADKYRRLFERISPTVMKQSFESWLSRLVLNLGSQVIPIDGKTVKGSYERNDSQSALHKRQCLGKRVSLVFSSGKS